MLSSRPLILRCILKSLLFTCVSLSSKVLIVAASPSLASCWRIWKFVRYLLNYINLIISFFVHTTLFLSTITWWNDLLCCAASSRVSWYILSLSLYVQKSFVSVGSNIAPVLTDNPQTILGRGLWSKRISNITFSMA